VRKGKRQGTLVGRSLLSSTRQGNRCLKCDSGFDFTFISIFE